MAADDRLKRIKSMLLQLEHRAVAITQERDDERLRYAARQQAVFALIDLEFHLSTLINQNIMGHLSKNERLQKLQKENEELKQELEKYKSQNAPDDDQGGEDMPDADKQQLDVSLQEMSVKDIRSFVKDIDDVEDLERLLDAEMEGNNRKTAVGAIDSRIQQLTEDAED